MAFVSEAVTKQRFGIQCQTGREFISLPILYQRAKMVGKYLILAAVCVSMCTATSTDDDENGALSAHLSSFGGDGINPEDIDDDRSGGSANHEAGVDMAGGDDDQGTSADMRQGDDDASGATFQSGMSLRGAKIAANAHDVGGTVASAGGDDDAGSRNPATSHDDDHGSSKKTVDQYRKEGAKVVYDDDVTYVPQKKEVTQVHHVIHHVQPYTHHVMARPVVVHQQQSSSWWVWILVIFLVLFVCFGCGCYRYRNLWWMK